MRIDEMPPMCYWSTEAQISFLRRQILVHSILYYEMDSPVISDKQFDRLSRQLVDLCKEHQMASAYADYFYCMHDFDGSTGFDLYSRLTDHDREHLEHLARNILALNKQEGVKR